MIERMKIVWHESIVALWIVCCIMRSSLAQHSDVFISVSGHQIAVDNQLHADSVRVFDVLGDGTAWHGTNPGYSTSAVGHFMLNDQVEFNVVSPLLFSSGQSWRLAGADHYLRQFWPVFPQLSVTVTAETGNQPGFLIGSVGQRGTLHQHHTFELSSFSGDAPPVGAYAIQQVISSDGYSTSKPFWIVLNNGLAVVDFATTLRLLPSIGMAGDFDRNGVLDLSDVDRLYIGLRGPATIDEFTSEFDLNGDAQIDGADLHYWVRRIRRTWIGDANLDGHFNSSDLIQTFGFGHYNDANEGNSMWRQGDWNGDSEFDSGDLITAFQDGGYESGPRAKLVPEPQLTWAIVVAVTFLIHRYRQVVPKQSREVLRSQFNENCVY